MKRAVPLLVVLALLAAVGLGASADPLSASAESRRATASANDPTTKRDRVRRQRAAAAARLDALRADAAEVDRAIADLRANTEAREAELGAAKAAERQAQENVVAAQAEVEAVHVRISTLRSAARQAAILAFTSQGDSLLFSTLLGGEAPAAPVHDVLYNLAVGDLDVALNDLAVAQRQLAAAESKAERAAKAATRRRERVETKIADLRNAVQQQEQLGGSIQDRYDAALAEAANLEELDASLSKQIAQRERQLVAKARAAGIRGATVDKKGKIKVPVVPTSANGLVRVNGVLMDKSIGPAFAKLVAWAAEDGINLSGGGYRSAQAQINLRRGNCGPTDYDIWEKPSWECTPPAARPGHSLHERGLAIDVRCNGRLISRYSDPCFAWMAEHAPKVGLHNDVSHREAWHWSTTGG